MKDMTFVFGHKAPDTDSICSAIAYSELKRILGEKNIIPMRLGKLNKETEFVLKKYGLKKPELLKNVKPQVEDLEIDEPAYIYENESINKAMEIMQKKSYSSIPILNKKNQLKGVAFLSEITKTYFEISNEELFMKFKTGIKNLIDTLNAKILYGEYPYEEIKGRIYTYSTLEESKKLSDGDILIKSTLVNIENVIKNSGAGCIIIPDYKGEKLEIKSKYSCLVIGVPESFFKIIKLMAQSIAVSSITDFSDFKYFKTTDYIEQVKNIIKNSEQRFFPVVNSKNELEGILTGRDLINYNRKKVIMVDHNELGQSVEGIERAKILEIIDHHRIAEIHTVDPIYFRSEPVGCTSTIVYKIYKEKKIIPEKKIAGIMLSAIISDTLLFKSPTTTVEDKNAAKELALIAEENIDEYGLEMLYAGAEIGDKEIEEVIENDIKEFIFDEKKIAVSQFITVSTEPFLEIKDKIQNGLEEYIKEKELFSIMFVITDIIKEGSYIFAAGEGKINIFEIFDCIEEKDRFIKGMLSRKKQIIPKLNNFYNE